MVATANSDVYPPFPHSTIEVERPFSSDDGSGLHSPIFGAHPHPHGHPHGHSNNIRHQTELAFDPYSSFPPSPPVYPPQPTTAYHGYDVFSERDPRYDLVSHSYPRLLQPPVISHHVPSAPHRKHPAPVSRDCSYPPCGTAPVMSSDTRSIAPKGDQSDPHPGIHRPLSHPRPPSHPLPAQHHTAPQLSRAGPPPPPPPQQQQQSATQNPLRREASNLVIACRQCRARKIRCDSTRPICHNCVRRSNECQYDAVPKRRGPDKRPGTRQRSCKKRPADGSSPSASHSKRKKAVAPAGEAQEEARRAPFQQPAARTDPDAYTRLHPLTLPSQDPNFTLSTQSRGFSADPYSVSGRHTVDEFRVAPASSGHYDHQKAWRNLEGYSNPRELSMDDIARDLLRVFSARGHWLPVINANQLIRTLIDSKERLPSQLSLVYSGLAVATLISSSEHGLGAAGRNRAGWLRDQAQAALEASLNSHVIDIYLARAALMLAVYESSAHSLYTPDREKQALESLDQIIRHLGIAFMDSNEPDVSTFTPNSVPVARLRAFNSTTRDGMRSPRSACMCPRVSFPSDASGVSDLWSPEEAEKEDRRRLCWSALGLVAGYTSRCIAFRKEPTVLFMADPSNFRLLFPGEVSERVSPEHQAQSSRDSIWALYCRSMLVWCFCTIRLRNSHYSSKETSGLALQAWQEAQEIQDALNSHICNLDRTMSLLSREYAYSTQRMISPLLDADGQMGDALCSYGPSRSVHGLEAGQQLCSSDRKRAEQWLCHLDYLMGQVRDSAERPAGSLGDYDWFVLRPFHVTWFASQLYTCLALWEKDHTLIQALNVAQGVMSLVQHLNREWPGPVLQSQCDDLVERVRRTCALHISPPSISPTVSYSLRG